MDSRHKSKKHDKSSSRKKESSVKNDNDSKRKPPSDTSHIKQSSSKKSSSSRVVSDKRTSSKERPEEKDRERSHKSKKGVESTSVDIKELKSSSKSDNSIKRQDEKSSRLKNVNGKHHKGKKGGEKRHDDKRHDEKRRHDDSVTEIKPEKISEIRDSTPEDEGRKQREKAMKEVIEFNAAAENNDDDYNYDDDDFDDYDDDDFESDADNDETDSYDSSSTPASLQDNHSISDAERMQIREAMVLENSRVSSNSPAMLPSSPANTPVPSSPATEVRDKTKLKKNVRVLDFAGAQKSQAANRALSKTAQRGNDLMRLIELDTIYFELFEMKPQTEYELFMKTFGRSETYQKYTQYNEDCVDKETFTEPGDTKTCWTQHPMESSVASAYEGEEVGEDTERGGYNPITLSKFISVSCKVVSTLLEERASRHGYSTTFNPIESSKFSDKSAVFSLTSLTAGRSPIFITPITAQAFIICYTKSKTETSVDSPGLSCTWSLQNTSEPANMLVSNATHRCGCVSSYNHNIVFIGCDDGSVNVYDLNEPDNMHQGLKVSSSTYALRLPTYSTSAIQVAESHNSKITCIQAVRFDQEQIQMSSFQVASLDEHGFIVIWVVVSVIDGSFSGSQTDLGLRPGGKIKLVKSAVINVNFPQNMPDLCPELRTYAFQQSYSDPSSYFITTDKGSVIKASRNQVLSQPTYYSEEYSVPCIVGSVDFNKFNWKYFLAGTSDGSICLYTVGRTHPLVVWDRTTRGRPVRSVQWSRHSSTIFYAMDSANKFYMWDLSVRDSTPLVIESYDKKGLLSFTELLPSAGTSSTVVVLGFKDGSLEAHHVKEEALNRQINNVTKFEKYLSSVL